MTPERREQIEFQVTIYGHDRERNTVTWKLACTIRELLNEIDEAQKYAAERNELNSR